MPKTPIELLKDCSKDGDVNAAAKILSENAANPKFNVDDRGFLNLGSTALQIAVEHNQGGVAKVLIKKGGAELNVTTLLLGNTLMHIAAGNGNAELCRLLKECNLSVTGKNIWNTTPLMYAAGADAKEVCEFFLDNGAEINFSSNFDGFTALDYAPDGSKTRKFLIEKGARRGRTDFSVDLPSGYVPVGGL